MSAYTVITCPGCNRCQDLVGVEVRGVYDGVLYWQCACGVAFHRWPEGTRQHQRAIPFVAPLPQQQPLAPPVISQPAREDRRDG